MEGLKNTLSVDVTLDFSGVAYEFPAGKVIGIDDPTVTRWFLRKVTAPPRGRVKMERRDKDGNAIEVMGGDKEDGSAFEYLPVVDKPDKVYRFIPEAATEKPSPSIHGTPRKKGEKMPEPDAETKLRKLKVAIATYDQQAVVNEGTKRGIWHKGMEKKELVDKLADLGWQPPGFKG